MESANKNYNLQTFGLNRSHFFETPRSTKENFDLEIASPDFNDSSEEKATRISPFDLSATLVYTEHEEGRCELMLENIQGNLVKIFLGSDFRDDQCFNMNELINYNNIKTPIVDQIKLKIWEIRNAKSMNTDGYPQICLLKNLEFFCPDGSHQKRMVDLYIEELSNHDGENPLKFKIFMKDKMCIYLLQRMATTITHDSRYHADAIITATDSIFTKIEEVEPVMKEIRDLAKALLKKFGQGLGDFLPENIYRKMQESSSILDDNGVSIKLNLEEYVSIFNNKIAVVLAIHTAAKVKEAIMVAFQDFLLNCITNAIKANAKTIEVNCQEVFHSKQLFLEFNIIDDGCGIPEEKRMNLFKKRSSPEKSKILKQKQILQIDVQATNAMPPHSRDMELRAIMKNRGHGLRFAYEAWIDTVIGASAEPISRKDGKLGAQFVLRLPINRVNSLSHYQRNILTTEQLSDLQKIAEVESMKIILLADDQFLPIKMIFKSLLKKFNLNDAYDQSKISVFDPDLWPSQQLIIDSIQNFIFILVQNIDLAKEVIEICPLDAAIIDENIPSSEDLLGHDLAPFIREIEKKQSKKPARIVVHSSDALEPHLIKNLENISAYFFLKKEVQNISQYIFERLTEESSPGLKI